ncbi:hypothetical protein TIFTF001_053011 [Ficus carica]|uniref:Uncharacterized protein n=1 Tax=Ficus carica TaxID=3494 RepID=A0AA88EEH3_FICCA|nr:hypothetical protein TIFTF001_053011 [Ficus carica]
MEKAFTVVRCEDVEKE